MRQVPAGMFTREAAKAVGWSDGALARAARSGRIVRLRPGCYVGADDPTPGAILDARAVAAVVSGAVISHRSALILHDLPLVGGSPPTPELTLPPRGRVDVPRAHIYRASLPSAHVMVAGETVVTTPARTLVDVARHFSLRTSVAAIDAALNRGLCTPAQLDEVLSACWNWPKIRHAQRAVRLCDGRAESPLESVSRLAIRAVQLPLPELQVKVFDAQGRFLGRVDMYWDAFGVAGEADGGSKYDDREVLLAEKRRQEDIERTGVVVVRWDWDVAWRQPRSLRDRLVAGFQRGSARDRAGLGRGWSIRIPAA